MNASTKSFMWTNKPEVTRQVAIGGLVLISLIVAFFKLKPHFSKSAEVKIFNDSRGTLANNLGPPKEISGMFFGEKGNSQVTSRFHSTYTRKSSNDYENKKTDNYIVERPLFDGSTITLKVILTQSYSSLDSNNSIEARIRNSDSRENNEALDSEFTDGATLTGHASPNFEQKRINLQFTDLITKYGKHYSVVGIAIDPETKSIGVAAKYSSGITSRILGTVLDRAIIAGDQAGMARVFENTGDNNKVINQELNRMAMQGNSKATGELSQAATKDLRETKAELSLPAGTALTVKIKTNSNSGSAQ